MVRKGNRVSMETKCCEVAETAARTLASVSLTRPKYRNTLMVLDKIKLGSNSQL